MNTETRTATTTPSKSSTLQKRQSAAMNPFDEMDRLFQGLFPRAWGLPARWEWPAWADVEMPFEGRLPNVDVVDRDTEILVRAELPGVSKDDLDITLAEDTVTIKASTRQESKEEKGDYLRREITQGSFSRTIPLPAAVQGDEARASFKDGVLELTLPKAAPARRHSVKVE